MRSRKSKALEYLSRSPKLFRDRLDRVFRDLHEEDCWISPREYRKLARLVIPIGKAGALCLMGYVDGVFEVEASCGRGEMRAAMRRIIKLVPIAAQSLGARSLYADTERCPTTLYQRLGWEPVGKGAWSMTLQSETRHAG